MALESSVCRGVVCWTKSPLSSLCPGGVKLYKKTIVPHTLSFQTSTQFSARLNLQEGSASLGLVSSLSSERDIFTPPPHPRPVCLNGSASCSAALLSPPHRPNTHLSTYSQKKTGDDRLMQPVWAARVGWGRRVLFYFKSGDWCCPTSPSLCACARLESPCLSESFQRHGDCNVERPPLLARCLKCRVYVKREFSGSVCTRLPFTVWVMVLHSYLLQIIKAGVLILTLDAALNLSSSQHKADDNKNTTRRTSCTRLPYVEFRLKSLFSTLFARISSNKQKQNNIQTSGSKKNPSGMWHAVNIASSKRLQCLKSLH